MTTNIYQDRDPGELGKYYLRHVGRMNEENLSNRQAIACELAFRDMQLDTALTANQALAQQLLAMETKIKKADFMELVLKLVIQQLGGNLNVDLNSLASFRNLQIVINGENTQAFFNREAVEDEYQDTEIILSLQALFNLDNKLPGEGSDDGQQ